jgi:Fe-Mn family superoxide dismutase
MAYTLRELPYSLDALQPKLSSETLHYHYEKHHAGYVRKLNGLMERDGKEPPLEELIRAASGSVFENAAQIWNHDFYWISMTPSPAAMPDGLARAVVASFGSVEALRRELLQAGKRHFGSGWLWLVRGARDEELAVVTTHDAENPLRRGDAVPLLCCDLWEHAYYVDYRNERLRYLEAWWGIADWRAADARLRGRAGL